MLVERFLDANGNGTVDAGEPLIQSFRLKDGQVFSIGGIRNLNVPGDDDLTANGQIAATLSFASGAELSRASGNQLFRVSSPTGNFAAVQRALNVTQWISPQHVTGIVSSGGTPLPHAFAAVLVQSGTDLEFIAGAVADAAGHFSLSVSNGTYLVAGFKTGYIGNFVTAPVVVVSGGSTNVTVGLSAANLSISGTVTEAGTGVAIPGFQFFANSANNEYTMFFNDAQGRFNVPVDASLWKMDPSDPDLDAGGYLQAQSKPRADTSLGSVSGLNIPLTKGTALIYGTLKDDLNKPLGGVRVEADDSGNLYQSSAFTDSSGRFFLMVINNTWNVGVFSGSGLPNGYVVQQIQLAIANGQAIQTNLAARHATAHLSGFATDSNHNPINGGDMLAFGPNGQSQNATLGNDGSFDFPVTAGTWTLELDSQTADSRNLVSPQLTFNVVDGVNIANIAYVAPIGNRTISGWVKTGANAGVIGLNVYAFALINGTNYNANASTDAAGNYSMPVLAGQWNVGVDSQGLTQRGYAAVGNQVANTSSGNQAINFIVGPPPIGSLIFRHNLGAVGEFGNSSTPTVNYPVAVKNYRAIFEVPNEPNPPTVQAVLFTGPPGSGLTNTPADPAFGVVTNGTGVSYFSPLVRNPSIASGGPWRISYRTNAYNLDVPDPQVSSRILVPLPTITVRDDVLRSTRWSYKDQNGNPGPDTPFFVVNNRIDLIDQNGDIFDQAFFPAANSYTFPANDLSYWSTIGALRINYFDNLTNQYFVAFNESSPSLTAASVSPGQGCRFELNGPPGVNYTVQVSTNLVPGSWTTLTVTNSLESPIIIVDPVTAAPTRFYRVLVGP